MSEVNNLGVYRRQTEPADKEPLVRSASGATSSHFSPFTFYPTYEGAKLTSLRFKEGNRKHENDNTVYAEANWLKAFFSRDVGFFRDRAGHALEHLIQEMRGDDDRDPGGNLGGVGWFQDVAAFVKKYDPFFWGAIQGKWHIDDSRKEKEMFPTRVALPDRYDQQRLMFFSQNEEKCCVEEAPQAGPGDDRPRDAQPQSELQSQLDTQAALVRRFVYVNAILRLLR